MKRKLNSKSSIYSFLKSSGVLEFGTPEEIRNVRKTYWREYKRKWRKQKRSAEKEFTICLTVDELHEITKEAKGHKLSRTRFIKYACFAYIDKSFIVPDISEVRKISQLLSIAHNSIQESLESDRIEFKIGKEILDKIYGLEREILPALHNPKSLEEIIKEQIIKNPNEKLKLIKFINSI